MKKNNPITFHISFIVTAILFIVIIVGLFMPIFFEGKNLLQNDIIQYKYGFKQVMEYKKTTLQEVFWNNAMFCGIPTFVTGMHHDPFFLTFCKSIFTCGLPHPIGYLFTAMVSCYILLISFRIHRYLAICGSLAYGLMTFTIISLVAGHNTKIAAMAYIPLVLGGIHILYNTRHKWLGAVLFCLALSLEIASEHPQITYYLALMTVIYGISLLWQAIKKKKLQKFFHRTLLLLFAVLLSLGTNLNRLWGIIEYSQYSTRGENNLIENNSKGLTKDYVFAWSMGKLETMTLLIPNFYGGSSHQALGNDSEFAKKLYQYQIPPAQVQQYIQQAPTYWGKQPFTAGPVYVGAIVCFLFVMGICIVPSRHRNWLLLTTILAILLSWGKNFAIFNNFIYHHFPLYNKFRSVTMVLSIAQITMVLLALLGLQQVFEKKFTTQVKKSLYIALATTGGLVLFCIFLSNFGNYQGLQDSSFPIDLAKALQIDRKTLLQKDAWRSLLLIITTFLVLYFSSKQRWSIGIVATIMCILMLTDVGFINKRYLTKQCFTRYAKNGLYRPSNADLSIQKDSALNYRVFNIANPFNQARTSYHHQSIGGYYAAKLGKYQHLIDQCIMPEHTHLLAACRAEKDTLPYLPILNMLNTKYYLLSSSNVVYNKYALGNVWLIDKLIKVGSAQEEMHTLKKMDTKHLAVIDTSYYRNTKKIQKKYNFTNNKFKNLQTIKLIHFSPNHLQYAVDITQPSFAVFSEIYYPKGWQAAIVYTDDQQKTINKKLDHFRVNYVLRGMPLPAGKYVLAFTLAPSFYFIGKPIASIFSILLCICIVSIIVLYIVRLKQKIKNRLQ